MRLYAAGLSVVQIAKRLGVTAPGISHHLNKRGIRYRVGLAEKVKELSPTDLAYLAGIIDGEGCITIAKSKRKRRHSYWVHLSIANTNVRLIEWLRQRIGGGQRMQRTAYAGAKQLHVWYVYSRSASDVLRAVAGHLVAKPDQARLALELQDMLDRKPTPEREARCEAIKQSMHGLH